MKSLKLIIWNTFYKFHVLLFSKKDNRVLKYKSTICLIFKNEAPFLKEWIEYHLLIGIKHFYLYNNNSSDNYMEVLKPYLEANIVTLIDWPYEQSQRQAYKNAWETFKKECNWMCFLDADEFICMNTYDNINEWLNKFSKYPAVHIYWRMFGTGAIMKHDFDKLVIEQYTSCWDMLFYHGKNFVNTRFEIANWDFIGVHHNPCCWYSIFGKKVKMQSVSSEGYIEAPNQYWHSNGNKPMDIQINHYFCKSWDLFQKKRMRTDVAYANDEAPVNDIEKYFYDKEEKCISKDYTILRYYIRLKNNLKLR